MSRRAPHPQVASATVADFADALDRLCPPALAEDWDNTGLLLGRRTDPVTRVMLCIDLVDPVVDEAIAREVDAIVAYHPPIFGGIAALTADTAQGAALLATIQAGIAVHSPHTAADAAVGGVNDWLAEGLGDGEVEAIRPASTLPPGEAFKIVTFTPPDAIEPVRTALATAGCGRIGDYDLCSIETPIVGTFRGGDAANPAVGRRGRLERVEERRLEMACGKSDLGAAVAALRSTHPYEEPAFEIHPLVERPDASIGAGRIVRLDAPAKTTALVDRLRKHLRTDRFSIHEPNPRRRHRVIGLCAGSGGELVADAVSRDATLFLTGELKHHDVLDASRLGASVILAGHTNTERGWLKVLARRLRHELPGVECTVSRADRDPLRAV